VGQPHEIRWHEQAPGHAPYARYRQATLMLSVGEAAELLAVSHMSIRRLAERGELASVKVGTRTLIPRTEADRLVSEAFEQQKQRQTAEA